jgi:hypothetical protein
VIREQVEARGGVAAGELQDGAGRAIRDRELIPEPTWTTPALIAATAMLLSPPPPDFTSVPELVSVLALPPLIAALFAMTKRAPAWFASCAASVL